MIAILATSKDTDRRYYAKWQPFKRCVLEHDPSALRPLSVHQRPLRAKTAMRVREIYQAGLRANRGMQAMHDLVLLQHDVSLAMAKVLNCAATLITSASQHYPGNRTTVDAGLLAELGVLVYEAQEAAEAALVKIPQVQP
jgi:hypothetical protein